MFKNITNEWLVNIDPESGDTAIIFPPYNKNYILQHYEHFYDSMGHITLNKIYLCQEVPDTVIKARRFLKELLTVTPVTEEKSFCIFCPTVSLALRIVFAENARPASKYKHFSFYELHMGKYYRTITYSIGRSEEVSILV